MRSASLGLAVATFGAWLFFLLYMGALAVDLSRFGGTTTDVIPALFTGAAGLIGSAYVGFFPPRKLSRAGRIAIELLLLGLALFFLIVVTASRTG
jgi:peptidoglycan/LPS O-acetylase OafA/YrhL